MQIQQNNKNIHRLKNVHDMTRFISGEEGFVEIIDHILDIVISTIDSRGSLILCFNSEISSCEHIRHKGLPPEYIPLLDFSERKEMAHCIVTRGQPLRLSDVVTEESYEKMAERIPFADHLFFSALEAKGKIIGLLGILRDQAKEHFSSVELEAFCSLGSLAGVTVENARLNEKLREEERLNTNLSRYFSPYVIERIKDRETPSVLTGESMEASVLISDIQGFTEIAENLSPHKTVELLNRFLTRMVETVFRYNGTVDKFTGDGILAVFGAPLRTDCHAPDAVRAALDMLTDLRNLNDGWKNEGWPLLRIRIGVCTGPLICGNIGSENRMEFTVIGNTVNLASRLEQLNKKMGTRILISESTYENAKEHIAVAAHDNVRVSGVQRPCTVYELLSGIDEGNL